MISAALSASFSLYFGNDAAPLENFFSWKIRKGRTPRKVAVHCRVSRERGENMKDSFAFEP